MARGERFEMRLSVAELAALDEQRGPMGRAAFIRLIIFGEPVREDVPRSELAADQDEQQ